MRARLVVSDNSYSLAQEQEEGRWEELAVLPGGARTLLPQARPVDEASLERAIQVAEDWLMPHAARVRGQVLEVADATGRLEEGLRDVLGDSQGSWSVEEVEGLFLRLLDMTTGRSPSAAAVGRPSFVADVLLLRELAHHGQLARICL